MGSGDGGSVGMLLGESGLTELWCQVQLGALR